MSLTKTTTAIATKLAHTLTTFTPKLGFILGSGLNSFADQLEHPVSIPYQDIPGFPSCGVGGHRGHLIAGYIEGQPVIMLAGRAHIYEGYQADTIKLLIRSLQQLGVKTLVLTNASGSLNEDVGPGELGIITDHINLMGFNPLIGANDSDFGPRFISMQAAYDPHQRQRLKSIADDAAISIAEGIYCAVSGPSFETPAEIRAFKTLGADFVGMSTVPETIVARHCGLEVLGVTAVTNYAAGIEENPLSHDMTLSGAELAIEKFNPLMTRYVKAYYDHQ